MSVRITYPGRASRFIPLEDARGYLGLDRRNAFPNESDKAHDAAVKHALRTLTETGDVDSWTLDPQGNPTFTIALE